MKRNKLFYHILIICFIVSLAACKDETPEITEAIFIEFPDSKFKSALVNNTTINTNADGEISPEEARAYTGVIQVAGLDITDMTGIEEFVNVTGISCFNNNLTSVDISKNIKVVQFLCESNNISELDLSNNFELIDFKSHSNKLTKLNVANGNNSNFIRFEAQENPQLQCIQVDAGFMPPNSWLKPGNTLFNESCEE